MNAIVLDPIPSLARTTLDLPAPLMREIKARAALSGSSMKDFMTRIMQKAIDEPVMEAPQVKKAQSSPDWMAHAGALGSSSAFAGDPVEIQKKMREQWQRKRA